METTREVDMLLQRIRELEAELAEVKSLLAMAKFRAGDYNNGRC